MKRIILLFPLIFSACRGVNVSSPPQRAKLATSNQTETSIAQPVSSEFLISSKGIGKAQLGMTLEKLKQISSQDTSFEIRPSFMVDVDAIAVSKKGIVQYYILYPIDDDLESGVAASKWSDLIITNLVTSNDNYQTQEGVKVGTPIKEAEDVYGNAVLAYNIEGESREYITFGNKNPENIRFRASYFKLISDGLGFSGIYPEYPGVSYTTDKYNDDAAIAGIEVSCDPNDCIK